MRLPAFVLLALLWLYRRLLSPAVHALSGPGAGCRFHPTCSCYAAEAVRARIPFTVLTQRDMPKPALVKAFSDDENSCLFATSGFFQGVDIPGRTLSLVVIDRIPFPRPDDPLLSARREQLGPAAFGQIDLPRASMLLAQAVGRLIRTSTDRGVVAVMDPRLGNANYRWDIVKALPPMARTRHRADAAAFLRDAVG